MAKLRTHVVYAVEMVQAVSQDTRGVWNQYQPAPSPAEAVSLFSISVLSPLCFFFVLNYWKHPSASQSVKCKVRSVNNRHFTVNFFCTAWADDPIKLAVYIKRLAFHWDKLDYRWWGQRFRGEDFTLRRWICHFVFFFRAVMTVVLSVCQY